MHYFLLDVHKLQKSLYTRYLNTAFRESIMLLQLKKNSRSLHVCTIVVVVHVDNLIIMTKTVGEMQQIKSSLVLYFEMKDLDD